MDIKNVFLLIVQLFLLLLTSVCVIFCKQTVIDLRPHLIDKGLDSVISRPNSITINDVITDSEKFKECGYKELEQIVVLAVVSLPDKQLFVVSCPLYSLRNTERSNHDKQVLLHMKSSIMDNNGVIFPARTFDTSSKQFLSVIVTGMQDIQVAEEVIKLASGQEGKTEKELREEQEVFVEVEMYE